MAENFRPDHNKEINNNNADKKINIPNPLKNESNVSKPGEAPAEIFYKKALNAKNESNVSKPGEAPAEKQIKSQKEASDAAKSKDTGSEIIKAAELIGLSAISPMAAIGEGAASAVERYFQTTKAVDHHTKAVNDAIVSGDPAKMKQALNQNETLTNQFQDYVKALETNLATLSKKL